MNSELVTQRPPPVLTKQDFVRRYEQGEFGNHSPTWLTIKEFCRCVPKNDTGRYHLRSRIAGDKTFYNLTRAEVFDGWYRLVAMGLDGRHGNEPFRHYISEMAPHQHNLFQGELIDGVGGWQLFGSFEVGMPMREALTKSGKQYAGLAARRILQQVINYRSFCWLNWLLEAYEGHVIEFSAFSRCWGTCPGENVVWWEVRQYDCGMDRLITEKSCP